MGKAGGKGIPLWDYIKSCDEPEHVVRMKLDRGELRHTWFERDGTERASDDGGPQRPKGWWLRAKGIDQEEVRPGTDTSMRWVSGPDYGPSVATGRKYRVKVFPAVTAADTPAPARKLTGKEWVQVAYARRPGELDAMTITEAGRELSAESKTAPDCAKPLSIGHCINLQRILKLRPK